MNSKIYVVLIIISLLLAGCGGQIPVQPTETSTPIPPTATVIPPTKTVAPEINMPILNYGEDSWEITSIEACTTVHTSPFDTPNSVFSTYDGWLIRLTVKCTTQKPLFPVMQGFGGSPFQASYLTDANNQKYPSFQVGGGGLDTCETNYVLFSAVPQDQKKLTLYFLDMSPIELPEPTHKTDCLYQ